MGRCRTSPLLPAGSPARPHRLHRSRIRRGCGQIAHRAGLLDAERYQDHSMDRRQDRTLDRAWTSRGPHVDLAQSAGSPMSPDMHRAESPASIANTRLHARPSPHRDESRPARRHATPYNGDRSACNSPGFGRMVRPARVTRRDAMQRHAICRDQTWNRSLRPNAQLRSGRWRHRDCKPSTSNRLTWTRRVPRRAQTSSPAQTAQFQITPVRSRVRVPHRPLGSIGRRHPPSPISRSGR